MPDPSAKSTTLAALFAPHLAGDVLHDNAIPAEYGGDASPYRRTPAVVIRPRDRDDIVATIRIAAARGIALVPRAAGTSLAGQCVGIGDFVVLDIGAFQHHIIDLDVGMRLATVQPGMVRDVLNRQLAAHDLMFAPDPSTTDRCQIGGMVGNNAWGLHAVGRGTTRDHVAGLEVVLADGSVQQLAGISTQALRALRTASDRGAALHAGVHDTVQRHLDAIDQGFPSLRGITNNAGYPLDVIRQQQPFNPQGPHFNLAPLLCGSEGTLAIVTKARLRLIERPRATQLCCVGFPSIDAALGAVAAIHATAPAALELLDRGILRVAASDAEQVANRFWLRGDPAAVLLVEYAGADATEVSRRVGDLQRHYGGTATTVVEGDRIEQVWALRRAALKMLMGAEGGLRALTGIEDAAVSVGDLPMFYREVGELLARDGLSHYVYGPVGMGSLHIRPELPRDGAGAIDRYQRLLDQVAAIAVRFRGTFSCKHGDGRMRGRYLDAVLGSGVVDALRAVKRIFDPGSLLNPGKILDCPPFAEDLSLPGML